MEAIGIMLIGVLVGKFLFSNKHSKIIEKIQCICVIALIFLMGVTLGNTKGFLSDLASTGFTSVVYAIIPIILSTILVFIFTKKAFANKEEKK